jgi:hypothetical protein
MAGSATPGEPAQSYSSSTLNSIRADPRKDHDRVVDAIIQYNVENYEDSSIDIILKEVPYYHTGSTSPDEPEARHGKSKGEIDVGLVNLDEGIIRYLEIKTHPVTGSTVRTRLIDAQSPSPTHGSSPRVLTGR